MLTEDKDSLYNFISNKREKFHFEI